MMKLFTFCRYRDLVSALACVGCLGVCTVAVRDVVTRPVRFLGELNHAQLLERLSTSDVRGEFISTRLRLARRAVDDLRQGYDWQSDLAALSDERRERCVENLRELTRVWLLERADRYVNLAEPDRTAFVDEQLDDLRYWPIWRRRHNQDLAGLVPDTPMLAVQQLDTWTGQLDARQRQRIQQFAGALYFRWLQRGYQFLPGGA